MTSAILSGSGLTPSFFILGTSTPLGNRYALSLDGLNWQLTDYAPSGFSSTSGFSASKKVKNSTHLKSWLLPSSLQKTILRLPQGSLSVNSAGSLVGTLPAHTGNPLGISVRASDGRIVVIAPGDSIYSNFPVSYYSDDGGNTWSAPQFCTSNTSFDQFSITNDGTAFLLQDPATGWVYRNVDGASTWTRVSSGSATIPSCIYGNGRYVAGEASTSGGGGTIYSYIWSLDGITWTTYNFSAMQEGLGINAIGFDPDNNIFFASSQRSGHIMVTQTPETGASWVDKGNPYGASILPFDNAAYGNGIMLMSASTPSTNNPTCGLVRSSDHGVTWQAVFNPFPLYPGGFGYNINGLSGVAEL